MRADVRQMFNRFSEGPYARGFQEYAESEPADTRSKPGPYIFGTCARTSTKCSTVSACDRKLREPRTRVLRSIATEILNAPGLHNVEATIVCLASRTPQPSPIVFASSSPHCLRSNSAPSPPPLLPMVLALISENNRSQIFKRLPRPKQRVLCNAYLE